MIARNKYQSELWAGRTVGLLGGSFNPAHDGHRHISLYALKMLGLDAVWWMVSPQNPLKSTRDTAPLEMRISQAKKISAHPKIIVTDIEKDFGTHYTSDTLKKLQTHYPYTKFIWLMGSDNLQQLHRWHHWQDIFKTVPVCVLARPPQETNIRSSPAIDRFKGFMIPSEKAQILKASRVPAWVFLHIPLCDLSSTYIRENK